MIAPLDQSETVYLGENSGRDLKDEPMDLDTKEAGGDLNDDEGSNIVPENSKKRPSKKSGEMLSGEKPTKRVRISMASGVNECSVNAAGGDFTLDNGIGNDEESKIEN